MQPNIFMWGGLVKSIIDSDLHIILDVVKSSKNSRYNRNRIAGKGEPSWLTIPYIGFKRDKEIMNQTLDTSLATNKKIINFFSKRYSETVFFQNSLEILETTLNFNEQEKKICSVYENFLSSLKDIGLPISKTVFASNILCKEDLNDLKGIQLVNRLLKKVNAKIYLGSENTLNYAVPSEYNVSQVWIQKFTSKPYSQIKFNSDSQFIPNLSILDIISYLNKDQILDNLKQSNQWVKYIN